MKVNTPNQKKANCQKIRVFTIIIFAVIFQFLPLIFAEIPFFSSLDSAYALPPPIVTDDGEFTQDSTQLHASWNQKGDAVFIYTYAVGTSTGAVDVVDWTFVGTAMEVTHTGLSLVSGQVYYFSVKSMVMTGNRWSSAGYSDGITVDSIAPKGSIIINNGDNFTLSPSVVLTLSAQDETSGVDQMKFSNDALAWSAPEAYATSKDWTLDSGPGQKTVYVQFLDNAANWSLLYSDTIVYDNTPATTPVVTDDGKTTNDGTQLHASWSSQDPESDITEYQYAIGTAPGATDVVGWTSTGLNTEVTHTNLNLSIGMTYYFSVKARNGVQLWSPVGSSDGIMVISSNQPPHITSVLPLDNTAFTEEDGITIVIEAQDPDDDPLTYRFSVEGTIIGDWTSSNTYIWQTQPGDINFKTITGEVRDVYEESDSAQINVFLYRKVPQPE